MLEVGFEPTHPKIIELKSTALDRSAIQAYLLLITRQQWDSNPRGQSPLDFESNALTTRPCCLCYWQCIEKLLSQKFTRTCTCVIYVYITVALYIYAVHTVRVKCHRDILYDTQLFCGYVIYVPHKVCVCALHIYAVIWDHKTYAHTPKDLYVSKELFAVLRIVCGIYMCVCVCM